jgi:predicted nucleic acid-binding Zn ribbon protein
MRCGSCGGVIEKDEDVAWIRGSAICPQCVEKGQALRKTFLKVWVVVAILVVVVPIVLFILIAVFGGLAFFNFMR